MSVLSHLVGRSIAEVLRGDVNISRPDYARRDPNYYMSTILVLDNGSRYLFKSDKIVPYLGSSTLVPKEVDGEGEYKALGQTIKGIMRDRSSQLYLRLENGIHLTVNDNQGYYLDMYTAGELAEMAEDDPKWELREE